MDNQSNQTNPTTEKIKEVIAEVVNENKDSEMFEEGMVEFTTAADYITSAYFAISSIDDIDTALCSKEDEKRVKRIKRKAIKIIDICLSEMYDELFENDDDE